jgi:hypothetical protein
MRYVQFALNRMRDFSKPLLFHHVVGNCVQIPKHGMENKDIKDISTPTGGDTI